MRLHAAAVYQERLLKTIEHLYRRAPHYEQVRPALERAINYADDNLSAYLCHSLKVISGYLGITTPIVRSSERHTHLAFTGQQRLIEICRAEGADTYVNAEGGMQLYQRTAFQRYGVDLCFLVHEPRPYRQKAREFLPRLSIIDVMMFNNQQEIARLLGDYRLVRSADAA